VIGNDHDMLRPVFYLSPAIREWVWGYLEKTVVNRGSWKI
jgi:hypothetical protein